MIVPDVNVLLCSTIDGFPQHERARTWWEEQLSGDARIGLAPVAVFGFVRLATSRRVFATPMAVDQAIGHVHAWTARGQVQHLGVDQRHVSAALDFVTHLGIAANLTTDAQIAAHALVDRATIATNDTDFGRFEGVRTVNPLAR